MDHRGVWFVVVIFVGVLVVFGVAYVAFVTTLQPPPSAPVAFAAAYMVGGNGTFNVSSDSDASWSWSGFSVNLTVNNFGATAVGLAPSGENATLHIGSGSHALVFDVIWLDRDGNGAVSVGDAFWITGVNVPLPALSYVQFGLIWRAGGWTASEFFVTSSAIV